MSVDKTTSRERLSFTLFLAIAVHALIILGLTFKFADKSKVAPTINITLATHASTEAPDKADFLAQHNQLASGTKDEAQEITTREMADVVAPNINEINPVPKQQSIFESAKADQILTTSRDSDFKIRQHNEDDEMDSLERIEADDEDTPYVNPEIASLRARLDKQLQEFARRPRIRRMTSASTKSSVEAAYLNKWTQKVESIGNQNFPAEALNNKIFGSLRVSVIINSEGEVVSVEVLKPSGYPILDRAAIETVHRAAPYDRFPQEIREEADQLDIIRTWRFEITGLVAGGS